MKRLFENAKYEIILMHPISNPMNDNVDVEIRFSDAKRYAVTFFTLRNVEALMKQWKHTGEAHEGLYFSVHNPIIVRELTEEVILKSVMDIISQGEHAYAFYSIDEVKQPPPNQ